MFLAVLELAVAALLVGFVCTQIVLPMMRGTSLFPVLRKEAKLQADLEEVKQQVVEKKIEEEIKNLKDKESIQ
jgi:hypothetical protein